MSKLTGQDVAKEASAVEAVKLIRNGMVVGLGTGSTARYFISHLAERCREGLSIKAVATSEGSSRQAREAGISLLDINELTSIDIDIDGADEIDPKKRLIKGGGGAAFREKIVASMSNRFVVIADESKLVDSLGKFPLAIEILPFGHAYTMGKLEELGYPGKLRKTEHGEIAVTDNGNYICDISLPFPLTSPEKADEEIKSVVGVIETGFFIGMASQVIIGFQDGHVEILE